MLDGGFQELVRLGELPVSDTDVQASLGIIDSHIAVTTPSGTGYYRYGDNAASGSADGYGDCYQPSQTSCTITGAPWPPTDIGTGHLWPVLSGERAESDVAEGNIAGAESLLQSIINFSSGVGLVPEQAWEDPDLPASPYGSDPATASIGFTDGKAAGSASPLTWAQAQELRLILAVGTGSNVDTPALTTKRYVKGGAPGALPVSIAAPANGSPARHRVHHRDRDDRAEGDGDGSQAADTTTRRDRDGDQHDRGEGRLVLRDGSCQLRQQRDHRDRDARTAATAPGTRRSRSPTRAAARACST